MSKTSAANTERPPGIKQHEKASMLPPARMASSGFGWQTFEATVPADTTDETLLLGGFWRLCANRLQRGDRIKWRTDSLTRHGELLVIAIDAATGQMELRELWRKEVPKATAGESERCGFTPKDFGVHEQWGVVRDADGHVMTKGIGSYDEAMRRIRVEYLPNLIGQQPQFAPAKEG